MTTQGEHPSTGSPQPVTATSFRVEWSDGSVWSAEGEVAAAVMKWYQGAETMNCIRGAKYSGPQITITPAKGPK